MSVAVAMTKPDVRSAVLDLLTCRWRKKDNKDDSSSEDYLPSNALFRRMSSTQLGNSVSSLFKSMRHGHFNRGETAEDEEEEEEEVTGNCMSTVGEGDEEEAVVDSSVTDEVVVADSSPMRVEQTAEHEEGSNSLIIMGKNDEDVKEEEAIADNNQMRS